MTRLLTLCLALLLPHAAAQLRADIQKNTPPGQATMKVYNGEKLLWQATTPGLNAVTESKFSADGKWLLNIADGEGYVQLWDVTKGKRVNTFLAPFARILNADFTPDSRHLLLNFRGERGEFPQRPEDEPSFWNVAPLRREADLSVSRLCNGRYVCREGGYDRSVAFSADGQRMVFASSGGYGRTGAASVFDARTGQHVSTISRLPYPKGAPQIGGAGSTDARLSPDGARVLVLYVDGRLAEYDVATAKLLKVRGKVSEAQARALLGRFARDGK